MFGAVLSASLLVAGQGGDLSLGVEAEGRFAFTSAPSLSARDSSVLRLVIAETVTNLSGAELVFTLGSGERFAVPAAVAGADGAPAPSVTVVRTSYRLARSAAVQSAGATSQGKNSLRVHSSRWQESGPEFRAFPDALLDAKLIDGGPDGTALVRCACRVSGSREKGYTYAYVVDNQSDKPVKFQWAGFEGEVQPKQDFVKLVESKDLTVEESGLAVLDFGSGRSYTIRTNFWARPK